MIELQYIKVLLNHAGFNKPMKKIPYSVLESNNTGRLPSCSTTTKHYRHIEYINPSRYGHLLLSDDKFREAEDSEDIKYSIMPNDTDIEALYKYLAETQQKADSKRTSSEIAKELEIKASRAKAKTDAAKIRRNKFASDRARLVLMMIESGVEYVCNDNECDEREYLAVDHVHPLSRGGGDEIENLQFLCTKHNSQKGDKM